LRASENKVSGNEWSISISGLTKRFGKLTALDGISLSVRKGEFFGFLGPNGAGKSTTIKILCGLLRADEGRAEVLGYDVGKYPLEVKRNVGVLLEDPPLYERLTAYEFLVFVGQMHGISRDESENRCQELLELMELTEAKNKLILDYSMGMKKKTALAGALIHAPKVLFLDEPFNGIDPVSVRNIRSVLERLREKGVTIFFCTHVMEVAEKLCTDVAIINKGKIVAKGTILELKQKVACAEDSTLEDVFLKLVEAEARRPEEKLSWLA